MSAFSDQVKALARPMGAPTGRRLGYPDFTAGDQVANHMTQAAYFRVPSRLVTSLVNGKAFRLQIRGKASFTAAGGSPEVFDLTSAGFTNGIAQPASGTSVYAYVAGTLTTPSAINYSAGTVSLTTTVGQAVVIYALPVDGSIELRAETPTGGQGYLSIFNDALASLNSIDQSAGLTAPKIDRMGSETPLAPDWQLGIYMSTPVTVAWEANAKHAVAFDVRNQVVDPVDRNKLGELIRAALGF